MTKQLRKIFTTPWKRTVSSALLILYLFGCVGSTMAMGKGLRSYVLPRYPEVYRRARIEGSFIVEVAWKDGKSTVNVISHEATGAYGTFKKPDLMIENITEALGRWQLLTADETRFRVTITFRLSDRAADRPSYNFRVTEQDFLPTEIIVEADQPAIQTNK